MGSIVKIPTSTEPWEMTQVHPATVQNNDAAYWDKRATDHDEPADIVGWASHPFLKHESFVYQLLNGLVLPGSRVLDVGCGFGRFAPHVHELRAEWVGLDFSQKMHELWQEEIGVGKFVLGNARTPPKDLGQFQTVLFCGSDGSIGLPKEALKELYTPFVKRPGHIVIVGPYTTIINNLF